MYKTKLYFLFLTRKRVLIIQACSLTNAFPAVGVKVDMSKWDGRSKELDLRVDVVHEGRLALAQSVLGFQEFHERPGGIDARNPSYFLPKFLLDLVAS